MREMLTPRDVGVVNCLISRDKQNGELHRRMCHSEHGRLMHVYGPVRLAPPRKDAGLGGLGA